MTETPHTPPPPPQRNNPLHGITLEAVLTYLVKHIGWEVLGSVIDIKCFTNDPSIRSSLKFLRKTPWARAKVEQLYLWHRRRPLREVVEPASPRPRPSVGTGMPRHVGHPPVKRAPNTGQSRLQR